jgi:Ca2+-transporting ATPase
MPENGSMCGRGLTSAEAKKLLERYGRNELAPRKKENFLFKAFKVIREPMFLLLIAAAVIYFVLGEPGDGAIMLVFVLAIIAIETFQEWKTDRTLSALKSLSAPHIRVMRDGEEKTIDSSYLVPGDVMLITEGVKIPADGIVLKASDLKVDESSLTGEPEGERKTAGVEKRESKDYFQKNMCYAGTLVVQGTAAVFVTATGALTEYGKIGTHVAEAPDRPTPLEKQTAKLVKYAAMVAAALFALVALFTFFNLSETLLSGRIIQSILSGITLAMAMIPEEFPVVLAVFLSMGAWRLARKNSLVRHLPSVETLGAVSVLCVDKTGTITKNQMEVKETWTACGSDEDMVELMGLACETDTYDPMEKAMIAYCAGRDIPREHLFGGELMVEYPFSDETKIMGHLWEHEGGLVLAAKGSPESMLSLCGMTDEVKARAQEKIREMSGEGLRVIAVGKQEFASEKERPDTLAESNLAFCGLVGLADPPRESVRGDIERCVRAGVRVVMITGDNGITAASIARQIGMPGADKIVTGAELKGLTDEELKERVRDAAIFSRVTPAHKMRIVRALRDNGEVVAMTGDGVNDAPALKYADIGIAMGKRGSEVSREAADLVLLDDNFSTIVQTIRDGRRIYDNIRKAIGYIFTIHIPIALISLLAPLLGIAPAYLMLLPLHVVLLELIIDPTCSIVLERQPAEADIMERPPRRPDEKLLTGRMAVKSAVQGAAVFAAAFGAYFTFLRVEPGNAELARTMGIAVMLMCNVLLVLVNSSDREFTFRTIRFLAKDKVMWAVTLGTLAVLLLIIYSPLNVFLKLTPLSGGQLLLAAVLAVAAVMWFELFKLIKKMREKGRNA